VHWALSLKLRPFFLKASLISISRRFVFRLEKNRKMKGKEGRGKPRRRMVGPLLRDVTYRKVNSSHRVELAQNSSYTEQREPADCRV
jgi:hypothetical protein